MGEFGPGLEIGIVAGEDLVPFRFVAIGSDGRLYQATGASDEVAVGVTTSGVSFGSAVAAVFSGVAKIESAQALSAGGPLSSDGFGRAMPWLDTLSPALGICLADAGGAGEIVPAIFTPRPAPISDRQLLTVSEDRFPLEVAP